MTQKFVPCCSWPSGNWDQLWPHTSCWEWEFFTFFVDVMLFSSRSEEVRKHHSDTELQYRFCVCDWKKCQSTLVNILCYQLYSVGSREFKSTKLPLYPPMHGLLQSSVYVLCFPCTCHIAVYWQYSISSICQVHVRVWVSVRVARPTTVA